MICISCNKEHNYNFCPNCGQDAIVKKITFLSVMQNAFSIVINMDKGFFYNFKLMFINPKSISNDYLIGKRKYILNPISIIIVILV